MEAHLSTVIQHDSTVGVMFASLSFFVFLFTTVCTVLNIVHIFLLSHTDGFYSFDSLGLKIKSSPSNEQTVRLTDDAPSRLF